MGITIFLGIDKIASLIILLYRVCKKRALDQ